MNNLLATSTLSLYVYFSEHFFNIFTNSYPSEKHIFIQMPLIIFISSIAEKMEAFTFKFPLPPIRF